KTGSTCVRAHSVTGRSSRSRVRRWGWRRARERIAGSPTRRSAGSSGGDRSPWSCTSSGLATRRVAGAARIPGRASRTNTRAVGEGRRPVRERPAQRLGAALVEGRRELVDEPDQVLAGPAAQRVEHLVELHRNGGLRDRDRVARVDDGGAGRPGLEVDEEVP